jgi:drug/metabolite transporter (DMT)-like permease
MEDKKRVNAYFLVLIGILSVSTAAILIRLAQRSAGSLSIATWRLIFASILAWMMVLFSRKQVQVPKGGIGLLFLAGLALAIHFASWISSLEYTSITSSTVLVNTVPLWVALVSPVVLKEKVHKAFYLGLALALAGGLIIASGSACSFENGSLQCRFESVLTGRDPRLGMSLALLGAVMAAAYFVIGRKVGAGMDTFVYTAVVYSIAASFLVVFTFTSGQALGGFEARTWLLLFAMAVIPQTFGHSMLNYALKFLPAMFVSLALLGEPIGTTILAIFLLKETPSLSEVIGGALILIGIFYAVVPRKSVNEA